MAFKISAWISRIFLDKSCCILGKEKGKTIPAVALLLVACVLLSSCASDSGTSSGGSESAQHFDASEPSTVLLNLPDSIYGLVGQEMNLYFDNLLNVRDTDCEFSLTCGAGEQWERFSALLRNRGKRDGMGWIFPSIRTERQRPTPRAF